MKQFLLYTSASQSDAICSTFFLVNNLESKVDVSWNVYTGNRLPSSSRLLHIHCILSKYKIICLNCHKLENDEQNDATVENHTNVRRIILFKFDWISKLLLNSFGVLLISKVVHYQN